MEWVAVGTQAPLIFDIETGPESEERLRELYVELTLDEFAGDCDRRWKPETVAAKFEEAKTTGWQDFVSKAALSPLTGRLVAIGYRSGKSSVIVGRPEMSDCDMLAGFWTKFESCRKANRRMIGHNIYGFDLTFLVRASWMLDVVVPATVCRHQGGRTYWNDIFMDTMLTWQLGNYREKFVSLDTLGKAFGFGGKSDEKECSGADFHKLWLGTPEEHERAKAYLLRDLELTAAAAERMGVA